MIIDGELTGELLLLYFGILEDGEGRKQCLLPLAIGCHGSDDYLALMITWPVDRLEHDKRQTGISEAEMMALFSLSSVVLDE